MIKYQKNNKVVYLHKYPDSGIPYYVGIGNPTRPYEFKRRSKFWTRTYDKYGVDIEIIQEGLTWEQACIVEQTLIKLYGRRDLGTGSLVNLTDGGDGSAGPISDLRRENISKSKIGVKRAEFSEEWKRNLGKAAKGRPQTAEARVKRIVTLTNSKVKLPSKKLVQVILDLYVHRGEKTSYHALARRFNMSVKVVKAIVKHKSALNEYYGL